MESTYPEIYMNLWQEMRQMQGGGEEEKRRSGAARSTPGGRSFPESLVGNGDGC